MLFEWQPHNYKRKGVSWVWGFRYALCALCGKYLPLAMCDTQCLRPMEEELRRRKGGRQAGQHVSRSNSKGSINFRFRLSIYHQSGPSSGMIERQHFEENWAQPHHLTFGRLSLKYRRQDFSRNVTKQHSLQFCLKITTLTEYRWNCCQWPSLKQVWKLLTWK